MDCLQIVNFLLMIISYFQYKDSYFKQRLNYNKQLGKINGKLVFVSDLTKQAQEEIFSRKIKKLLRSTLLFNNI